MSYVLFFCVGRGVVWAMLFFVGCVCYAVVFIPDDPVVAAWVVILSVVCADFLVCPLLVCIPLCVVFRSLFNSYHVWLYGGILFGLL